MASVDPVIFERPPLRERLWLLRALRNETVGGLLLLAAAVVAMVWANSPWGDSYTAVTNTTIGIGPLRFTVGTWAADALLAVFFFVAGLELKHELTHGTLRNPAQAAVPVAAALGGMMVPALIFVAVNLSSDGGQLRGWAIPMATDIAFALAVLAVVGRRLPVALRAFLLTLAVVDDLGAIVVIALFYSSGVSFAWLLAASGCLAAYALLQRRRVRSPLLYAPLAALTWFAVHEAGVHATVAGVALGLLTRASVDPGESASPVDRMQSLVQPFSAAVCVPLFALFAAGVDLRGNSVSEALSTPLAVGVMLGLVIGKPVGVTLGAWITARFTRARLSSAITWADVATIGLISGIGFTVSLLIAELGFGEQAGSLSSAKLAVLSASVTAAVLAAFAIMGRNRHYARLEAEEDEQDALDAVEPHGGETDPSGSR